MRWTAEQVYNLQTLLMHEEKDNVLLGLTILSDTKEALPQELIAALNLLVQLSTVSIAKDLAQTILQTQLPFSTPKRKLDIPTLSLELAIFPLAYYTPKVNWKRALVRYEKYRSLYEPLFLLNPTWQKWYRALVNLFYAHGDAEKLLHYCDALLKVQPEDFLLNQHRFHAINILLEQGKAYEHLQAQENWLFTWQRFYPKTDCMIYTLLGRLQAQYYQNIEKAEEYYLKALSHESKPQWYTYAAMAADNLAQIYKQKNKGNKALEYSLMATQWQNNNSLYWTTLALVYWKCHDNTKEAFMAFEQALLIDKQNIVALANQLFLAIELQNKQLMHVLVGKILAIKTLEIKYKDIIISALQAYLNLMDNSPKSMQNATIQNYILTYQRLGL